MYIPYLHLSLIYLIYWLLLLIVILPGKEKQHSDDSGNGIPIGIIAGACSALVLIVVILAIIIRKKRSTAKGNTFSFSQLMPYYIEILKIIT